MTYWMWLAVLSAVFVGVERLRPRDRRGWWRPGLGLDLFYLVFNGHFLGVLLAKASTPLAASLDAWLVSQGLWGTFHLAVMADWPAWAQLVLALLAVDLFHWGVHNLLHRVPALWTFHKVHHSIVHMDWIGSLRFHWAEVVIYKSLTYPLLALLGASGEVLFGLAVFNTAVGHFNHANLDVGLGPLGYVLNNPRMHIWHHVHADAGPPLHNFGITLSLWDYLFGTAHVPDHPPERLAFDGIDGFPSTVPGQLLHPLSGWVRPASAGTDSGGSSAPDPVGSGGAARP
ncbi:MAG: sterol desaturase family protein [Myxococcales bacterium]|nr:sterol desaturase family protein [Myxococcales bacterium]